MATDLLIEDSPPMAAKSESAAAHELSKRPRLGEAVIQSFLFLCGMLSVFTTVSIVYVLGTESLNFFTREQWENSNKSIAVDIDTQADTFLVSESGSRLSVDEKIRLGHELMRVVSIEGSRITVQRGVEDSTAEAHAAGQEFFQTNNVTLIDMITGTNWMPQLGRFGVWPLVLATLMTTVIAMLVALPAGLATAIYLSEYASPRARSILKPVLEVLAGIPTVVYGYFALTFMTPLLRGIFGDAVQIFNTASAGIVVGILIIPLVSSMSEDALHAVPNSLRQAAYGLGATKLETSLKIVLPAALSGIAAAFVVAISRAIGETMIVAIAAGAGPKNFILGSDSLTGYVLNPFFSAETLTGHIVRISGGDLSYDSVDYNSIFALGMILFLMTLTLNSFSRRIVSRFREVYE